MITTLRIETAQETKSITVHQANIMEHGAAIICFPYYINAADKGDIWELVEQRHGKELQKRPVLATECFQTAVVQHEETYYVQVGAINEAFTLDSYTEMLQMTFATVTALQNEGLALPSIALPVLFHKCIRNEQYEQYVQIFVVQLHRFLQMNEQMKTIEIYLWHDEDVRMWQAIMSKSIQLREDDVKLQGNRQQLLALLQQKQAAAILTKQNNPLHSQLQRKQLQQTALHNAMRLVEGLLDYYAEKNVLPKAVKGLYIYKKIQLFRAEKTFPEWFINYINSMQVAKDQALFLTEIEHYAFILRLTRVVRFLQQLEEA